MSIDRRQVLALLGSCVASPAFAQAPAMSRSTAYAFSFAGLDGATARARRARRQADPGRQHRLAMRLHPAVRRTSAIVGALPRARPADHRRALERLRRPGTWRPGRDQQDRTWRVRRELSRSPPRPRSKGRPRIRSTNGPRPSVPAKAPRWNFHKYLIGRDGRIAAVFSTQIEPTDPRVIAAIEKELL